MARKKTRREQTAEEFDREQFEIEKKRRGDRFVGGADSIEITKTVSPEQKKAQELLRKEAGEK